MDNPDTNRWLGKSPEDVLAESFHEIRNPIILIAGYLNVLQSTDISEEQARHLLDLALNYAQSANVIVDSVYKYMKARRKDQ
jgi:signal transduction histidine kinase